MRKLLWLLLLLVAAFAVYFFFFKKKKGPKGPKPVPIALKKHSPAFNAAVDGLVADYLAVKDALINADTAAAKSSVRSFSSRIDNFPMTELEKDTSLVLATVKANLGDLKANAESMIKQADITEMRRDFSAITEQLYPSFFMAVNYEGPTLYYATCPMAFNDEEAASWISNSPAIANPYLGKSDPKYHGGMLKCGILKDSIKAK